VADRARARHHRLRRPRLIRRWTHGNAPRTTGTREPRSAPGCIHRDRRTLGPCWAAGVLTLLRGRSVSRSQRVRPRRRNARWASHSDPLHRHGADESPRRRAAADDCFSGWLSGNGGVRRGQDDAGMAPKFIDCDGEQAFLMPPSLRDLVAEDHPLWDGAGGGEGDGPVRLCAGYRADGHGRPAYDPDMTVALLVYSARPDRSARRVHRAALAGLRAGDVAGSPQVDGPAAVGREPRGRQRETGRDLPLHIQRRSTGPHSWLVVRTRTDV
jgi:hypothetical protein